MNLVIDCTVGCSYCYARNMVFTKIWENTQQQFLFLPKHPDLLDFETDLENAWLDVTVTRKSELWHINTLRPSFSPPCRDSASSIHPPALL